MRTVNSFIGSPVERLEDLRFLRGRGEYVDDVPIANALHAVDPAQQSCRTAASARSTPPPR